MYTKILLPLDGSKLAECAIPYAEELAKGCNTDEILLVSVTERVRGRTRAPEAGEVYLAADESLVQQKEEVFYSSAQPDEPLMTKTGPEISVALGKMQKQAQRYLTRIAKGFEEKGFQVRTDVLLGKPAEEIVSFAEHNAVDIVVMSSHGRSGPSRWAYGSVAEKVLKASCIPVLMVRPPGCVPST